ncbi:MAG TPA: hypothetical protein PLP75_01140 [Burkholderiales bacterium]|nr:hypothetical protein [Burkholderiales bacterium]
MFNTRKEPGRGHITFTMINALVIIFAFSYKFPTTSGSYYFGQVFVYGFVTLMLLHLLLCRYSKLNSVMIIANLMMDAVIFALSFEHLDAGIKISQTWLFIFPFVLPIYSWIVHSLFNRKYYYDDCKRIFLAQQAGGWSVGSVRYDFIDKPGKCYF